VAVEGGPKVLMERDAVFQRRAAEHLARTLAARRVLR
jgi:hypothetical protein